MPNEITDSELAELKRVCEAATKEPWSLRNGGVYSDSCEKWVNINPWDADGEYDDEGQANCEFAIDARTALHRLIAQRRADKERIECLEFNNAGLNESCEKHMKRITDLESQLAERDKEIAELRKEPNITALPKGTIIQIPIPRGDND